MTIPRLCWQTWSSKTDVPPRFARWRQTFIDANPDWDHLLWDDSDITQLVEQYFPWFSERFATYPRHICRVDTARYLFLYRFGGFYADIDSVCLKSLDPLRNSAGVLLGRMGPDPSFEHSVPNAIMGSAPRQPFWLGLMDMILECSDFSLGPEWLTGPVVLKRALDLAQSRPEDFGARAARIALLLPSTFQPATDPGPIVVAAQRKFYPIDWSDPVHVEFVRDPLFRGDLKDEIGLVRRLFPRSFTCTFWAKTWGEEPNHE